MKRFLLVLGILAGVLLMLQWRHFKTTPDAPNPSRAQVTPNQAAPAITGGTISAAEVRAMILDLQMARMAIAEYFMTYDSLPRKFEDAHMPAPPHARLLENGSIEYRAGGRPTARVLWRLRPTKLRMEWDCVSPDIVNISERVEGCRYAPSFTPDDPIRLDDVHNHQVLFEFGRSYEEGLSTGERTAFQQFLDSFVLQPSYHPRGVQITSYADSTGDTKRNIRLAESRAAYVREVLAASGIDGSMINVLVIGTDPQPARDCPASLPREERIQCLGPSRRVDIRLSGQQDM